MGGVGSIVTASAFLGHREFQSGGPQKLFSRDLGQTSGALQMQIQRRWIPTPILGRLKKAHENVESSQTWLFQTWFGYL